MWWCNMAVDNPKINQYGCGQDQLRVVVQYGCGQSQDQLRVVVQYGCG